VVIAFSCRAHVQWVTIHTPEGKISVTCEHSFLGLQWSGRWFMK
jgi:hypothetical protein